MGTIRSKNMGLAAVLLLAGYLGAYVVLWSTGEQVVFALTEHGCFRRTREAPALRFSWMERVTIVRVSVTAVFRPINALRLSHSEWKRE